MTKNKWAQAPRPRNQLSIWCIDEQLAPDHPIRRFDALLRKCDWTPWEAEYENSRGRPPIHPRLVAGLILYGLTHRILSSRNLEEAATHRTDLIWLLEGGADGNGGPGGGQRVMQKGGTGAKSRYLAGLENIWGRGARLRGKWHQVSDGIRKIPGHPPQAQFAPTN